MGFHDFVSNPKTPLITGPRGGLKIYVLSSLWTPNTSHNWPQKGLKIGLLKLEIGLLKLEIGLLKLELGLLKLEIGLLKLELGLLKLEI